MVRKYNIYKNIFKILKVKYNSELTLLCLAYAPNSWEYFYRDPKVRL